MNRAGAGRSGGPRVALRAMRDPYPLGRPGDDVEAAARLYLRYVAEHPLPPDLARSFFMMCGDARAVMDRVAELRDEER